MNPSLLERMQSLQIREADLVEKFVLGSGSGGQKINKTASCVYLRHLPTKIEINCQESRSREANRELARSRLCDRIEALRIERNRHQARLRARRRYQKRKESPAQKARRRQLKKMRSEKKQYRRKVSDS